MYGLSLKYPFRCEIGVVLARIEAQEWSFCGDEKWPAGGQSGHRNASAFMLFTLAGANARIGNQLEASRTLERWLEDARCGWKYSIESARGNSGAFATSKICICAAPTPTSNWLLLYLVYLVHKLIGHRQNVSSRKHRCGACRQFRGCTSAHSAVRCSANSV